MAKGNKSGGIAEMRTEFLQRPVHRMWLLDQARALHDFFLPASINPNGGFHALDRFGGPIVTEDVRQELHSSARMVHCAAIADLLGFPGADQVVDHGMEFLWTRHRDSRFGGYYWAVDGNGAADDTKQAYGHAFVLLAAASAKISGHSDADRLLGDVVEVLLERFWEAMPGAAAEEYKADWAPVGSYRGQNSNMHLVEALMAAFEATGEYRYLRMADSIAELIVNRHARAEGWRIPEHYHSDWTVDRVYAGNPMFRPRGVTPGHAMEWARLLVQLRELGGRGHDWMLPAAEALFLTACDTAWDRTHGGFFYTLDWNNKPDVMDRYWWPCCEGIAAAGTLGKVSDHPGFETWYRRIWGFVQRHIIDHGTGGWFAELDAGLEPVEHVFTGKPDLYHAFQACLVPLFPPDGSIVAQVSSPERQRRYLGAF